MIEQRDEPLDWDQLVDDLQDDARKGQWLNVLSILNTLTQTAIREFAEVLKRGDV